MKYRNNRMKMQKIKIKRKVKQKKFKIQYLMVKELEFSLNT